MVNFELQTGTRIIECFTAAIYTSSPRSTSSSSPMATQQTVHAYRHLYRCLLHAVQFSKPARYVARDRLRVAFRQKDAVLDSQSISRTLQFLQAAARERGLEHKVLKNLLMTQFFRAREQQKSWKAVKLEQSSKNKR